MTCTSRSSGSPAADNAFSRSSPSKKTGYPAIADPAHPPDPGSLFTSAMPVVYRAVHSASGITILVRRFYLGVAWGFGAFA
jgi:hypothetical protein